jgi:hypothetical protein
MSTEYSPSLADSFELVTDRIPRLFLSPGNLERIQSLALNLPPVHAAGFEYRLKQPHSGLDFQQGISLGDSQLSRTRRFYQKAGIDHCGEAASLSAGEVVYHRLKALSESRRNLLTQYWLEFDCRSVEKDWNTPSIFLSMKENNFDANEICSILNSFNPEFSESHSEGLLRATLKAIQVSTSNTRCPSHIGFMLARSNTPIRLVTPFTDPKEAGEILKLLQWEGQLTDHENELTWALGLFKQCRICVDLSANNHTSLSIECFDKLAFDSSEGTNTLLEALLSSDLCTQEEVEVLKEWPGTIIPGEMGKDWPEDLIVRSLFDPEGVLRLLNCRLSHFKFGLVAGGLVNGKVYFGYHEAITAPN